MPLASVTNVAVVGNDLLAEPRIYYVHSEGIEVRRINRPSRFYRPLTFSRIFFFFFFSFWFFTFVFTSSGQFWCTHCFARSFREKDLQVCMNSFITQKSRFFVNKYLRKFIDLLLGEICKNMDFFCTIRCLNGFFHIQW